MKLESRKSIDSNLKFVSLVDEVCFQPWCKKEDKTDDDYNSWVPLTIFI
jgi:hypothetical protein